MLYDYNIFVHGLALSQAMLLAAFGGLWFKKSPAARVLIFYALSLAAFIITPLFDRHNLTGPLYCALFLESLLPVFFWYLSEALFFDYFKWRPYHAFGILVPLLTLAVLNLGPFRDGEPRSNYVALIATNKTVDVLILVLGLRAIIQGWRHDMLGIRLVLRRYVMIILGVIILGAVSMDLYHIEYRNLFQPLALAFMFIIFAFLLGCNVFMLFYKDLLFPWSSIRGPIDKKENLDPSADPEIESKLNISMQTKRLYSQEGLTISQLSLQVAIPEYRLRNYINRKLGYRNFNQFLSSYRIEEAKARLRGSDGAKILAVALDVGYSSLAPFNRAFKEITGQTPSEFRKSSDSNENNPLN